MTNPSSGESQQGKCPRCGTVMCQQFDDKPGPNGVTLAVPNGKYICYKCRHTSESLPGKPTKLELLPPGVSMSLSAERYNSLIVKEQMYDKAVDRMDWLEQQLYPESPGKESGEPTTFALGSRPNRVQLHGDTHCSLIADDVLQVWHGLDRPGMDVASPTQVESQAVVDGARDQKIKNLTDRCEANVVSFSNDDVSFLLVEIEALERKLATEKASAESLAEQFVIESEVRQGAESKLSTAIREKGEWETAAHQLTKNCDSALKEVQRLREALQKISDFDPYQTEDYKVLEVKRTEAFADTNDCSECDVCRQRNWPPSHTCNTHYSAISSIEDQQNSVTTKYAYRLKDIARSVLSQKEGQENG